MYHRGGQIARYLIREGAKGQRPIFSGIYQTFYGHFYHADRYRSPSRRALETSHLKKHDELIVALTKLSDLRERYIELSKRHSKLVKASPSLTRDCTAQR